MKHKVFFKVVISVVVFLLFQNNGICEKKSKLIKDGKIKFKIKKNLTKIDINDIKIKRLGNGKVFVVFSEVLSNKTQISNFENGVLKDKIAIDGKLKLVDLKDDGSKYFLKGYLKSATKNGFGKSVIKITDGANTKFHITEERPESDQPFAILSYPNKKYTALCFNSGLPEIESVKLLDNEDNSNTRTLKWKNGVFPLKNIIMNDELNTMLATIQNGSLICFSLPEFKLKWIQNVDKFKYPATSLYRLKNNLILATFSSTNNELMIFSEDTGEIINKINISELKNKFKKTNLRLEQGLTKSSGEIVLYASGNNKIEYFDVKGKKIKEYNKKGNSNFFGKRIYYKRIKNTLDTVGVYQDKDFIYIEELESSN